MTEHPTPPRWWQRGVHRLTSTRLVARASAKVLPGIDRTTLRLSGGRFTLTSAFIHVPVVMLITTGTKSGLPRAVPLLGFPDGDKVVVIASSFGNTKHPAWYLNLRANPQALLAFHGKPARPYVAREASGAERATYWQRVASAYPGYNVYKERTEGREIPVMVLEPASPAESNSPVDSTNAPQGLGSDVPSA